VDYGALQGRRDLFLLLFAVESIEDSQAVIEAARER
jgi:hypothetical protein